MANYSSALGGGVCCKIDSFLLCMWHLHNVLGHTVWTALSTSKYTVGNNLALASVGCLDDLILLIFNSEICSFYFSTWKDRNEK